jgi:hypothetical protein
MYDKWLENVERQLAERQLPSAPAELRIAVLSDMRRELAAARRDRWLGRAAGLMLLVGVGMNLAIGLRATRSMQANALAGPGSDSLAQVAVVVAEATDAHTGRIFARQLAALGGWPLTREQSAAIDAAVHLRQVDRHFKEKDG